MFRAVAQCRGLATRVRAQGQALCQLFILANVHPLPLNSVVWPGQRVRFKGRGRDDASHTIGLPESRRSLAAAMSRYHAFALDLTHVVAVNTKNVANNLQRDDQHCPESLVSRYQHTLSEARGQMEPERVCGVHRCHAGGTESALMISRKDRWKARSIKRSVHPYRSCPYPVRLSCATPNFQERT